MLLIIANLTRSPSIFIEYVHHLTNFVKYPEIYKRYSKND